jgi:nitrogen fixation/metabolism regulation signal transduction histidine kinase
VAPVFTPEILDQYSQAEDPAALGTPATGTTAPASPNGIEGEGSAAVAENAAPTGGPSNWRIEERDSVRLSVQDHGIGIPARDLDRIFERFYRVDHGRSRDTGGTGLGLSIVRHVANNHHGWVDVESREGEGSTFTLVLPLQAERVGG